MKCLTELGYDYIMPSPELNRGATLRQLQSILPLPAEMLIGIHGRTPLMPAGLPDKGA